MRLRYVLIGMAFWLVPAMVWAEFYRYTDERGVIHFTDNFIEIPENQRPKVEIITRPEETPAPEVRVIPERPEGAQPPAERIEGGPISSGEGLQRPDVVTAGVQSQQQFEALIKTKADLDKIYNALAVDKEALEKEGKTIQTVESIRAFQDKVNGFNQRLADYERQRQEFQARADAYNRSIVK